ncbi:MAG: DUF6562 domain-containing protein, partial [Alistipes sp.]|nr:DUF6562 domain-containing protein [Alistipes sp.]
MKKFLALAALVLGMVSCQQDYAGLDVDANGEAAVTVSVAIPEMETRAGGEDSDKGAFGNVDFSNYDVRYILEVYNINMQGELNEKLAKERLVNIEKDGSMSTAFDLRLIPGRDYRFVVWADLVTEGTETDLHYRTTDLKNIQLATTEWALSDESRDAYTGIKDVERFSNSAPISIELKRPLGKLRVVTTDVKDMFNVLPEEVKVVYASDIDIYTAFNAYMSDVVSGSKVVDEKIVKISKSKYAGEWNDEDKVKEGLTLFTDYFFAAKQQEPIKFTLDVKDHMGGEIPRVVFNTPIPIQRNYLTTVTGPILTDSGNIIVTINDAFENGTNWNPEDDKFDVELISGIKTETLVLEAGNYLFDDVTIKAAGNAIEVNGDVVIDVMGVMTLDSEGGIVVNDGSLVINGVVKTRGAERAGILKVETKEGSAIGGSNITIQNLAGLTAKANGNHAFGIGAADATVVIKNTKIDYVCGGHIQPVFVSDTKYGKSEPEGGAAIGGANVTIENSEIVKAEGGSKAAAIGNKFWADTNIVIKNSTLGDIFGGNASAAIGGSRYNGESKHNISIEIENSTITNAVGGQAGAGIGSGYDTHCNQQNYEATNNIVIKNSTIKAKGGKNAAGIGTGYHSAYLTGSIDAASTVEATRGDEPFYKNTYTVSQNIGYGIVDPAREFSCANAEVTFTVAGKVIATPAIEVNDATSLATALKADRKNISVVLTDNIELPISSLGTMTGGSGEYKLGGEATEEITIDLGGKTLNITTTYWSNLGAKNANALFTIKNGTMTSSQATGTWNSYDLTFSNCDYVFENVKFAKAVAFDNAGKAVTMKNVTINETHDYYAMWITATGQTVNIDGLTINAENGRGIKIDEQYVGTPAKVTMNVKNATFKTAKKAAIVVKSAAGADIALENVNIANVAADPAFAVWVDEDAAAYADLVNVTGGLKKVEGSKSGVIAGSQSDFAEAVGNSETATIVLNAGTYTMPSTGGKDLTIIGDKDVIINAGAANMGDGNVTLEGVTITAGLYKGFQHSGVVTYNNVTIKGQLNCYGKEDIFTGCTFELDNAYVWTYGSDKTVFNNCTFNTNGKAILIYNEGAGAC